MAPPRRHAVGLCAAAMVACLLVEAGGHLHVSSAAAVNVGEGARTTADASVDIRPAGGHFNEEPSPVDITVSSCLCGGIALVMMLFYLVNSADPDIRFYAWSAISSTISIFIAVLVHQGVTSFVRHSLLGAEAESGWCLVVMAYLLMLLWMIVLQVTMTVITVLPLRCGGNRHQMTQCWGTLCAHITGFASIRAGCALQHIHSIVSAPAIATAMVLAHCSVLMGVGGVLEKVRECVLRRGTELDSQWAEDSSEAEDDVAALALSFLSVQVLRFAITGILPNHEGLEEPQVEHSATCSVILVTVSLVFAVLVVGLVMAISRGQFAEGSRAKRILRVLQTTSAMAFAWSVFFASKWEMKRLLPDWDLNCMAARVGLSLAVSAGAIALIFVLDALEDLDSTGRDVDRAIVSIINAMGILVGFCWEQSFEGAVGVFAALTDRPHCIELGLGILIAVVVIPAWRNYIITSVTRAEVTYLRNEQRMRTRQIRPEALALALESSKRRQEKFPEPPLPHTPSHEFVLSADRTEQAAHT
mmetsp:Transcript_69913/g.158679  ORF Transcript_69913/g.158679 Transcript_69913/m.158679 type:complete len:530 (-) Transcript_69913:95-1684(-)